jgi:intracellular multiplication protein IcmS
MDITNSLCELVKKNNMQFMFCGKTISAADAFSCTGLLPPMARRADKLCSLCLGYGMGVTFVEADKAILGTEVQFDDATPNVLRLAFIYDVILQIVKNSGVKDKISLDELMYD